MDFVDTLHAAPLAESMNMLILHERNRSFSTTVADYVNLGLTKLYVIGEASTIDESLREELLVPIN